MCCRAGANSSVVDDASQEMLIGHCRAQKKVSDLLAWLLYLSHGKICDACWREWGTHLSRASWSIKAHSTACLGS